MYSIKGPFTIKKGKPLPKKVSDYLKKHNLLDPFKKGKKKTGDK